MVELEYPPAPAELTHYVQKKGRQLSPQDFNKKDFFSIKQLVKWCLLTSQNDVCAYCERKLLAEKGNIDHVRPKSKFPNECFTFTNYVVSCAAKESCNHTKADQHLPIIPGVDCNHHFFLSEDGELMAKSGLPSEEKAKVMETIRVLQLNSTLLVSMRKRAIQNLKTFRKELAPENVQAEIDHYLQEIDFRYILSHALPTLFPFL